MEMLAGKGSGTMVGRWYIIAIFSLDGDTCM
jgi:hypothetical protein